MRRHPYTSSLQARLIKTTAFIGLALFVAITLLSSSLPPFPYYTHYTKPTLISPSSSSKVPAMSNGSGPVPQAARNDELADFLKNNKADFVKALDAGSSLDGWVIVMGEAISAFYGANHSKYAKFDFTSLPSPEIGNEAGDLDSIASAIGYAYFASFSSSASTSATSTSTSSSYRYIPLYQTEKGDLHLRPENVEAFKQSKLDPSTQILFLDHLKGQESKLSSRGVKYALVDANNLGPRFHDDTLVTQNEDTVVGIIDHHEDLGLFKNAKPRWIQVPTGSCASLVTEHFYPSIRESKGRNIPKELADLLISAIVIDTDNVKPAPKGKAVDTDVSAISHLIPLSSFSSSTPTIKTASVESTTTSQSGDSDSTQVLASWHKLLAEKKYDLSPLQGRDLLRRDYKEYESDTKHIRSGLSSVPMALKEWLSRPEINNQWEKILIEMENWGKERNLDIVGVLTSYFTQKKDGTTKKGREELYLFIERQDSPVSIEQLYSVFGHLEKDDTLELAELKIGNPAFPKDSEWQRRVFSYEQKQTRATRKQVAPALKKAIEQVEQ